MIYAAFAKQKKLELFHAASFLQLTQQLMMYVMPMMLCYLQMIGLKHMGLRKKDSDSLLQNMCEQ